VGPQSNTWHVVNCSEIYLHGQDICIYVVQKLKCIWNNPTLCFRIEKPKNK
jgi:hypothetical protein